MLEQSVLSSPLLLPRKAKGEERGEVGEAGEGSRDKRRGEEKTSGSLENILKFVLEFSIYRLQISQSRRNLHLSNTSGKERGEKKR